MKSYYRQGLAISLCLLLLEFPAWANDAELLGIAKATGRGEINGLVLPAETNVFSGDRIRTGTDGVLVLFLGEQERIHFAPNSRAQLTRQDQGTLIAVEQGTISFRSAGSTRAQIERFGLEVRTDGTAPAVAHISLVKPREARVSALRGSLRILAQNQSVVLLPGQAAMITAAVADEKMPGAGGGAGLSEGAKVAITLVVLAGIAAAIAIPLALREEAVSPAVP